MPDQLPLFTVPADSTDESSSAAPAAPDRPAARPGVDLRAATPLKAAIVAWREHLTDQGARENTVKSFGGDLNLFARFSGPGKAVGQISTRDLNTWLQAQRSSGRSPKTYARRVTSLKAFFRWLHQHGAIHADPAAAVIQETVLSPLPQILTDDDVQAALAAAQALRHGEKPDIRPLALFQLLIHTGIKKSECLNLVANHVDLSNPDEPLLWVRYGDARFRYKERKLPLDPSWIPIYQDYVAQFVPENKLFPYSPRRLEYLLEDVTNAAGLDKHISFEMCRWTCAVRDARAGLEFDRIRQKLGLSKIQWREIGMKLQRLLERGDG